MLQRRGQKPLEESSAVYFCRRRLRVELFSLSLIWRSSAKNGYPGAAEPGSRILSRRPWRDDYAA